MSPGLKRALSKDERSVSPPPSRIKTTQEEASESYQMPPSQQGDLRIFSWNVNGIGPFLQRPISFSKTSHFRSPLRDFLARHNWPHILCLQEVKINPKDAATQRALQHAANLDSTVPSNNVSAVSPNPTYTIHYSLPRDKYNATGFGGKIHGVATLIRDDLPQSLGIPSLTTRTRPVEWDLEGRVLITTLTLSSPFPSSISDPINTATATSNSNATHLHLMHAYWPNGTTLPYRSPLTGQPLGTRHDYKLRFHSHMLSEALTLQTPTPTPNPTPSPSPSPYQTQTQTQSHILLVGDMNIAPQRIDGHPNLRTSPHQHVLNRADFNGKFLDPTNVSGLKGVDVWRWLRGGERRYTYHPRGTEWGRSCDRVDLVVAGGSLVGLKKGGEERVGGGGGEDGSGSVEMRKGMIVGMEIHDNEVDRGHSDHVPLSVTLDLKCI